MEKKTIGAFIATLRKANGYTQEKLAEMLNVSNKAVSRWERDECAPDISLIPVIAEIFGVTCDELLKGERISNDNIEKTSKAKVEKQMKVLLTRAFSNYKMFMVSSLLMAVLGYVLCLGISYAFYRPIIGFVVMMLCVIPSLCAAVFGITKFKTSIDNNDMLENVDMIQKRTIMNAFCSWNYNCFFTIFSSIMLSLPLILFKSAYLDSVLSIDSYITFALMIAFVLILLYFALIDMCRSKFKEKYVSGSDSLEKSAYKMNLLQLLLIVLASISSVILPLQISTQDNVGPYMIIDFSIYLLSVILCIVIYIVMSNKNGDLKKLCKPFAVRNTLQTIPVLVFLASVQIVFSEYNSPSSSVFGLDGEVIPNVGNTLIKVTVYWNVWLVLLAIAISVAIFALFRNRINQQLKDFA